MNSKTIQEIINNLTEILGNTENRNRSKDKKILDFTSKILQDNSGKYDDYIDTLAYDMDYYDSDKEAQKKFGYFGDEKLEKMITDAIIYLNKKYKP